LLGVGRPLARIHREALRHNGRQARVYIVAPVAINVLFR
jgi:hypothetical protein